MFSNQIEMASMIWYNVFSYTFKEMRITVMGADEKREVTVRVSSDGMEAYVYLGRPQPGEKEYVKEEIMQALSKKNVTAGVNEQAVERMISERRFGKEMLVAKGKKPIDGQDGFYQYNFNMELDKKPKLNPDGSVDYWSIHAMETVEEGQVIAVYHEPVDGSPGMTVTGKLVMGKRGRPQPPLTGKGFNRSEDNKIYTAATTGKIEMINNRIVVSNVYEISGDVDLSTGNIDFRGDVVVHGGVTTGSVIRATGSVVVDGVAEACRIEAGKDIILRAGFLGSGRGSIKAQGNIYAKFFEYAEVECECCIEATSALNCKINCKDSVTMDGRHASIVGGSLCAIGGVEAGVFGNEKELRTDIRIGVDKEMLERQEELKKRVKDAEDTIKRVNAALKQVDEALKQVSGDNRLIEQKAALLRTRIAKQAEVSECRATMEKLQVLIERGKAATMRAVMGVHPGVFVSINGANLAVKEQQDSVVFKEKDYTIKMYSLKDELVG